MFRGRCAGCVVAILVGGFLCHARTSARPEPETPAADPVITVQELGKERHQCIILSTKMEPDGRRAYEVQNIDTGEVLTIVDYSAETSEPKRVPGCSAQAKPLPSFR